MPITVITGEQRGDEGKGRFVDMLAEEHDIVARFNGGPNAGHTVVLPDKRELGLHLVPSGIAHPHTVNVIGNGTLMDCVKLGQEIEDIEDKAIEVSPDNLKISSAAHLILPHHIFEDEIREAGAGRQGSTKSGIAQCARDKYMRKGVRAEIINNHPMKLYDIALAGLLAQRDARYEAWLDPINEQDIAAKYLDSAIKLGDFVTDSVLYLNRELRKDTPAKVLAEGAQAFLLDVDHGMSPYTTSSSPTSGGAATGLGVPPTLIDKVIGVSKCVQSHVGGGPFPTEIHEEELLGNLHGNLSASDAERGTTTNRTRRLGYLDLPAIRRSQMVNGTGEIALTKLDWLPRFGDKLAVCVAYARKGKTLGIAPDAAYKLEQSRPIYQKMPNWEVDISGIREFENLPEPAQDFVAMIEAETELPVTMIGVGPRRDQVIIR